ncbi:MAG: hypothetical protein JSV03_11160, partial [Planctomycetota bacterium]
MKLQTRSRRIVALLIGLLMTAPLLVGQGCPSGTLIPSTLQVVVKSPTFDQTVSAGQLVTIVYDAYGPGDMQVSAFYDRDGAASSGDEVVFGTGLSGGANQFTQLATTGLDAGQFNLGITVVSGSGTVTGYASGRIMLESGPRVNITSPAAPIRVGAGVAVPIQFSTNLQSFSYQTFYDSDGTLNGNEVEIDKGSRTAAAAVTSSLNTSGLSPGQYFIGVTITTSSGGSVTSYAAGTVTIVTGAFMQVLAPSVGVVAQPGTPVQIIVAANDPSNSAATIRIFYDPDDIFDNNNDTTITTLPVTGSGTTWDTANIPAGFYYIGAELQNGMTPPMVSYSAGPVQIGTVSLDGASGSALLITTPRIPTEMMSGRIYRINWVTNLKPGEGVVTVFREPDFDDDDIPDGANKRALIGNAGIDATQQFVDFNTTGVVGKFFIGITVTPNPDIGPEETVYADGYLRIRPCIFWVGELDSVYDEEGLPVPQSGPFQGGVFRGYNFQDNLGSAMIAGDDYDGDNRNEIILAAQFAKPYVMADGGRGAGEAYMIYSQGQRYSGTFDVNRVGSLELPGVVFTGIFPNPNQPNTPRGMAGNSIPYMVDGTPAPPYSSEGLQSLTLVPDQDGDGMQEIVFGFPWCNSYSLHHQMADGFHPAPLDGQGRLENNGHFLRGGLVVVSSANPLLTSRLAT